MRLIGISGLARAGKTTIATVLRDRRRYWIIALAEPLKQICHDLFDGKMSAEHLWGTGRDEPIEALGGLTARKALQTLGTEWGRGCYPDVWIDLALTKIRRSGTITPVEKVAISDVRFLNEARAIRTAGGEVWRIRRAGAGLAGDAGLHVSEQELTDTMAPGAFLYDAIIDNDGTLEDLTKEVLRLEQEQPKS
jgi:hypothetical protein